MPGALPEVTFAPLPDDPARRTALLLQTIPECEAVLIGPGLDQQPGTRDWFLATLSGINALPVGQRPRLVVDADGLNLLSREPEWWRMLPPESILTPHPGEMARLAASGPALPDAMPDLLTALRDRAAAWGHVIVRKSAVTLIVSPDAAARPWLNFAPNPAMATAGSGDVLAGTIASLLAQGMLPTDAAVTGVALHSRAGALAAHALGDVQAGMLAGDIARALPQARASFTR